MAGVRAEFRVDLYVPDPDHPVLGRGTCPVSDCDRSPTGNGLYNPLKAVAGPRQTRARRVPHRPWATTERAP
jgi:hypothetical protein